MIKGLNGLFATQPCSIPGLLNLLRIGTTFKNEPIAGGVFELCLGGSVA